jgi:hypothetical protein
MIVLPRAAGAHQRGRALEDFAADHVERDVDLAGVLQPVGLQVHERVRTQAEGGLPVPGPAGADHAGAQLEPERARAEHAKGAALAGLRSALDGKLSSGLDAQVRVPDPAGNAQEGVL